MCVSVHIMSLDSNIVWTLTGGEGTLLRGLIPLACSDDKGGVEGGTDAFLLIFEGVYCK